MTTGFVPGSHCGLRPKNSAIGSRIPRSLWSIAVSPLKSDFHNWYRCHVPAFKSSQVSRSRHRGTGITAMMFIVAGLGTNGSTTMTTHAWAGGGKVAQTNRRLLTSCGGARSMIRSITYVTDGVRQSVLGSAR